MVLLESLALQTAEIQAMDKQPLLRRNPLLKALPAMEEDQVAVETAIAGTMGTEMAAEAVVEMAAAMVIEGAVEMEAEIQQQVGQMREMRNADF